MRQQKEKKRGEESLILVEKNTHLELNFITNSPSMWKPSLLCYLVLLFVSLSDSTSWWVGATELESEIGLLSKQLLDSATNENLFGWLKKVRRKLHEYPELSFEEYETSQLIRSELDSIGVHYKWPVAKTGIIASIGSGGPPFFSLRADMDALPIQVFFLHIYYLYLVHFVFKCTTFDHCILLVSLEPDCT